MVSFPLIAQKFIDWHVNQHQTLCKVQVIGQRVLLLVWDRFTHEDKTWVVIEGLTSRYTEATRVESKKPQAEELFSNLVAKYTLPEDVLRARRMVRKATEAAELAVQKAQARERINRTLMSLSQAKPLNRNFEYLS